MPKFSQTSIDRLKTCDERLQRVFAEVVKHRDCTVLCGERAEAEQNQAVKDGMSKTPWPLSKHNRKPGDPPGVKAADVAPWPIDWTDRARFTHFAGFVLGIAASQGIALRWGGDWALDGTPSNDKFFDGPHFELIA